MARTRQPEKDSFYIGLRILEYLVAGRSSRGVSQIASALGAPVSSIHDILKLLVSLGFVSQQNDTHRYQVTTGMFRLINRFATEFGIIPHVRARFRSCETICRRCHPIRESHAWHSYGYNTQPGTVRFSGSLRAEKNTMNHSLKVTLACTLLGVGFLIGTPRTHAALLAYDDFAYSAGNVNGDNGGTGWSSAWVSSASPVYASVVTGTALAYTGGSISVSGSGTALSIIGGGDGALNRSFVGTGAGSEVFFSFLFQSVVGSGDEFFHFYLSNDADRFNSGGIGDFNTAGTDSRFGARINDGTTDTTVSSSISYVTGSTYFLVGRLSTDGSGGAAGEIDRVELWVNPTSLSLGTASATADDAMGLTIADLDVFSSRMVNFAGTDQVLIDELRIGTDIASVVPEPSAGMLVLLGGLFLLARRRKAGGRKA